MRRRCLCLYVGVAYRWGRVFNPGQIPFEGGRVFTELIVTETRPTNKPHPPNKFAPT